MARYFASFKANTSLHNQVMVFNELTRNQVWDMLMQHYQLAVHKIYTEQEMAQLLPQHYQDCNNWVQFGAECILYKEDEYGAVTSEVLTVYQGNPYKVSVKSITDWFKASKPNPTIQNIYQQIAYHFEEVAEMAFALGNIDLQEKILAYKKVLLDLSEEQCKILWESTNKVELLDALSDQVVTATGVAYMANMKFDKALTEVNSSNYSKFENGKPVINEQGKIIKGKNYFKPKLEGFIND